MFHATPAQTERNFTCLFRGEQRNPGEKKKNKIKKCLSLQNSPPEFQPYKTPAILERV